MRTKQFMTYVVAVIILCGCKGNTTEGKAEQLLQQAQHLYEQKQYRAALSTIDSLRHAYPNAIASREKAITLYQDIALEQSQTVLAQTDSALQTAQREYDRIKKQVEASKAKLQATAEELNLLTMTRMRRDSLQVKFDVECARIKYIHKRQKQ